MPDYDAARRQMEKANFDEYELDMVMRFIGFVQHKAQKGQFRAHRAPDTGLVEIELHSFIGRKNFMLSIKK